MSKKTLLILAFIALAIYGAINSKSNAPEKNYSDIHPKIKSIAAGLVISNADTFAYYRPEITLNKDFKYTAQSVGKGGNIVVPWGAFSDDAGKRFSFLTSKIVHLKVVTAAPNGKMGIFISQAQ